jgi:cellulose synthase/poly-beta-1,6-N-acetylglucosamine synthase-like glycosyltransferase
MGRLGQWEYSACIYPLTNPPKQNPSSTPHHSHHALRALTYEIIVVDDGSKDKTCDVVRAYSRQWGSERVRLLKLRRNRGKGGALREVGGRGGEGRGFNLELVGWLVGFVVYLWL